jgi:hypothetical protein
VEAELSEGEAPRVIADVSSYEQMLAALRSRVNELQINGERFDEYAGLPRGYLSKLIGARPIRRLGMTSFEPVLASLGLRCLLVVDEEATRRLKERLPPRNEVRASLKIRSPPGLSCRWRLILINWHWSPTTFR